MGNRIRSFLIILSIAAFLVPVAGRVEGAGKIDRIEALAGEQTRAADYVRHLSRTIGSRVGGSEGATRACRWAEDEFRSIGLKNVHLEDCGEFESEEYGGMIYNVVGDIPGSESPDEYIIVGAHIDCVPVGNGATDNASGVGAVMEAARLLVEAGAEPKRTIRFILFGGEEVGLIGSKAYVKAHPDLMPKISAVYNMDMGSNYISGLAVTGPMSRDMKRIFSPVSGRSDDFAFTLEEMEHLPGVMTDCCKNGFAVGTTAGAAPGFAFKACAGAASSCATAPAIEDIDESALREVKVVDSSGDTLTLKLALPGGIDDAMLESILENIDVDALSKQKKERMAGAGPDTLTQTVGMAIGSSDHAPFLEAGVPAFTWKQEGDPDFPYPLHTEDDTYDAVDPDYLQRSAFVISVAALRTADLEGMISRERLTKPRGDDR